MKFSIASLIIIGITALAVIELPAKSPEILNGSNGIFVKRDRSNGNRRQYGRGRYGSRYRKGRYYRNGRYWDYGYGPDFIAIGVNDDFIGNDVIRDEAIGFAEESIYEPQKSDETTDEPQLPDEHKKEPQLPEEPTDEPKYSD
ncbi:hypothetical protein AYI68_g8288 [Smittium mucronatum]|uniref:Uncharacterized protein n=1 Tax=Smittium mucronatum TaxID=133383 RepID=A0A1R0GLC8_9FUNG|nr:hypothetical protein AYI68_g8288 [Smittium mucronatum]